MGPNLKRLATLNAMTALMCASNPEDSNVYKTLLRLRVRYIVTNVNVKDGCVKGKDWRISMVSSTVEVEFDNEDRY